MYYAFGTRSLLTALIFLFLLFDLLTSPRNEKKKGGGHYRGHAGRDGDGHFRAALSEADVRRGHCRAARGDLRRGDGSGRAQTVLRHLLYLHAAGLRSSGARCSAPGACLKRCINYMRSHIEVY